MPPFYGQGNVPTAETASQPNLENKYVTSALSASNLAKGYKTIKTFLTQSGTTVVATMSTLKDEFPQGDFSWSYAGVGLYDWWSLSGSFTNNKTFIFPRNSFNSSGSGAGVNFVINNTGSIRIQTQNSGNVAANSLLSLFPVEIQVWD